MKRRLIMAFATAALIATAPRASANSLWPGGAGMFADHRASMIGDTVMVRVVESVTDTDEGKVKSSKATDESVDSGFGILDIIRGFGIGSTSSMNSNTKVERTKKLNTTVSCLVTDIMPNGNMVIQGDKLMTNGAEKMNVQFSGVIRPQDIASDNTVQSVRVANAEIVVTGKGTVSRTQRPGIINQVLSAIF